MTPSTVRWARQSASDIARRALWSVLATGAFMVAIAWTLATRVPNILDGPFTVPPPGSQAVAVRLLETAGPPPPVYVMFLRAGNPSELLRHPELSIQFATFGARVRLTGATLEIAGTDCVYESPPGASLVNNELLPFVRRSTCEALRNEPGSELKLTVRLARRDPIAVWAYAPVPGARSDGEAIEVVGALGGHGPFPVLRGRWLDSLDGPGTSRIDLLGYMWARGSSTWLWWTIAIGATLLFSGLLLVSASSGLIASSFGVACLAGAIALLWAVLMPPLQAADEPDHLLSFARLVGRDMEADLQALARQSHFDRIAFTNTERFRPVDRGRPHPVAWSSHVFAEDTAQRSPLTAALWGAADRGLDLGEAAPLETLLRLRLLNALMFALAFGASALVVQQLVRTPSPWSLVGLGLAPTIPYFAVMVSEWALVVAVSILLAAAVLVVCDDGPRAGVGGLLLGGTFGLLAATSLAAFPLIPLLAALLAGRIVLGSSTSDGRVRSAVTFWGGFVLALAAHYVFVAGVYSEGYSRGDASSGTGLQLLTAVNRWLAILGAHPWLVVAPIFASCAAEIALDPVRRSPVLQRAAGRAATVITGGAAVLAATTLLASLFVTLPSLPPFETHQFAGSWDYVKNVVAALGTSPRLAGFDTLTFTTFWSGFGWLDTVLPDAVLATLAAASVGAFVLLVARLIARGEARRLAWVGWVLVGAAGSTCAYAVATYYLHRNVHGRYLIALYLPLLALVGQGIVEIVDKPATGARRRVLAGGVIAGLLAVHAYSIVFVLRRFF